MSWIVILSIFQIVNYEHDQVWITQFTLEQILENLKTVLFYENFK